LTSIHIGDLVRINSNEECIISDIQEDIDYITIFINIDSNVNIQELIKVEFKKLIEVRNFGLKASLSDVGEIRTEAHYLVGQTYQLQGNLEEASSYYYKSLENNDFTPSLYNLAQILYLNHDYVSSLAMFERIANKNPSDKDTRAFLILLKSILSKEISPFEIIKDLAINFQFEIDLWILQGNLRLHDTKENLNGLKCLLNALNLLESNGSKRIDYSLYSNISALYFLNGNMVKAHEYCLKSLKCIYVSPLSDPKLASYQFENIFYSWKLVNKVVYNKHTNEFISTNDNLNFNELFYELQEVVIGGYIGIVKTISSNSFVVQFPTFLQNLIQIDGQSFEVSDKNYFNKFYSDIKLTFNYGKILEEMGEVLAATEIFSNILVKFPEFIECTY
jgi:hypothetical protein